MSNIDGGVTKSPLASKTIQGIVLTLIGAFTPQIAAALHIQASDVSQIVEAGITLLGAVWAIYGRLTATTKIG